jgi:hypothetical protein
MKIRSAVYLSLLVFVCGFGSIASAKSECESYLFDAEFLTSLNLAMSDDYRIELLAKDFGDGKKFVILMGETHIKTPASAEIGRNVLRHFEYIGYEGYLEEKTWGGKISLRVIDPILKTLNVKRPAQFALRRAWARWKGAGRSEGSTIKDAVDAKVAGRLTRSLDALSDQELLEAVQRLADEGETNPEFQKKVDEIIAVRQGHAPPLRIIREMIHLEKDHVPDFYENLESVNGKIFWSFVVASMLAPEAYHSAVTTGLTLYVGHGWVGHLLQDTKYSRFFPMPRALITGRDATMARNIDETLEQRTEISELLAIVGKAHVDGMKELLLEAGYESIPLKF